MDKIEYFPRKKLFEDVQELVATFYSTGDYFVDQSSTYSSILTDDGDKDEFYYSLLLLSMLSSIGSIVKKSGSIIKNMRNMRIRKKLVSTEGFDGDVDIEEYIKRNYIEKVSPKEYPSIVSVSTFQLPEYQLVLWILRHCEYIYQRIFSVLGEGKGITAFEKSHRLCERLRGYANVMQNKYGIEYSKRESYYSIKKKVIYRYKNRKILSHVFVDISDVFERILRLKGIDMDSADTLEIIDHSESFDDRLFEIWLIKQSVTLIAEKCAITKESILYLPLYKARKENTFSAAIKSEHFRIEVFFQNRKSFMPKEELKWYYSENGKKEEIGAIPDLVFMKYKNNETLSNIVLVDAKNRRWTFVEDMQRIKGEIVQQIYIQDNFSSIFSDDFKSILVAHNNEGYQCRKYNHKDKPNYEIDVVSLDFRDGKIASSLYSYITDLCLYLGV